MSNATISNLDADRARVIVFANQKGGVGKSTSAEAFAASLTARGFAVLVVDMDAQPGNLSLHVGADKDLPGTCELLTLRRPSFEGAAACIQPTRSFGDVICANEMLDDIDDRLNSRVGRELTLSRALAPILPEYDFVIIDTPPALQVRTINAIAAADDVIVPCTADVSSVAGMGELVERVGQVRELVGGQLSSTRHEVRLAGVLTTRYDARNTLEPEMRSCIQEITEGYGTPVMCANVRSTVNVRKAQRHGMPLRDFAPHSTAALDYEDVVEQYLESLGIREGEEDGDGR